MTNARAPAPTDLLKGLTKRSDLQTVDLSEHREQPEVIVWLLRTWLHCLAPDARYCEPE